MAIVVVIIDGCGLSIDTHYYYYYYKPADYITK